ncbi:MAG: hypothetical protein LYZ66_02110 [Nitrososphaerales archaeon]|nr:hypothetical protein [Nitrososphaerales archaeon]
MSRSESTKGDTNGRTVQLVQLISEIGPDIPEIARKLGQFKESVRYRYKEKVLKRGLAVQAMVDHEKLGLKRVIMILDFGKEYRPYAETILTAMSELCYLVVFERIFPRSLYIIHASVPTEFVDEYISMMKNLESKGLFSLTKTYAFDWFRNIPMQAQFYDFDTGRWDFDWSSQGSGSFELANYLPSEKARFDHVDLLILKELYMDAARPLISISRKLKINYKKLAWHYTAHVVPSQLTKGYTLRWPGTRYDYKIDRALHRKHRYFMIDVMVTGLIEEERMSMMAKVDRLPFLWAEAGGRNYFAQLFIPVDFVTEALQYLEEVLSDVRDRAELYLPDQTHALAFTIGYKLYDDKAKSWTLDPLSITRRFDQLILRIKEGGQGAGVGPWA